MKRKVTSLIIAALSAVYSVTGIADNVDYLPVVEKNGEKCYYYTAEKGESVYGITHKFGWNADILIRYNPEANDIKNGQVIYYPCETDNQSATAVGLTNSNKENTEGERPHLSYLPWANGASANAPQRPIYKVSPEYYTVKQGETISKVARQSHMSVKQLFALNPGLTPYNFQEGVVLKLLPGIEMDDSELRTVNDSKIIGSKKYKVKQKDTWQSIAKKYHADTTQLKAVNPEVSTLMKGKKINVPILKDTLVEKWMPIIDEREKSQEGISQLYAEAHKRRLQDGTFKDAGQLDIIVLVSCDDANARRRDLEFLRGFMLGLNGKNSGNIKINLQGVDLADYGSLDKALASGSFNNADMMIYAVDKNFPENLVDYCKSNDIMLFNVFDAKTDISQSISSGVQLLPPSSYFYDRTSDFLTRVMPDRIFLFVDIDNTDVDNESMSGALLNRLQESGHADIKMLKDAEELRNYNFNPAKSYTVVSDAGKRAKILATLSALESVVDKYPNMPLSIVGRPNWMVYSMTMESLLRKLDTYIPSRFIFDDNSSQSITFNNRYKEFYNSTPLKTMPMYSVMGYDVANYFIDTYLATGGDFNQAEPAKNAIQVEFKLDRPQLYDGLVNRRVYLLHFTPFATTEKISL